MTCTKTCEMDITWSLCWKFCLETHWWVHVMLFFVASFFSPEIWTTKKIKNQKKKSNQSREVLSLYWVAELLSRCRCYWNQTSLRKHSGCHKMAIRKAHKSLFLSLKIDLSQIYMTPFCVTDSSKKSWDLMVKSRPLSLLCHLCEDIFFPCPFWFIYKAVLFINCV